MLQRIAFEKGESERIFLINEGNFPRDLKFSKKSGSLKLFYYNILQYIMLKESKMCQRLTFWS